MTEPDKIGAPTPEQAMWMATARALISLSSVSTLSSIALESMNRGDKVPDEFFADIRNQQEKVSNQIDRLITALGESYGSK